MPRYGPLSAAPEIVEGPPARRPHASAAGYARRGPPRPAPHRTRQARLPGRGPSWPRAA